ncbi:alanine racemase [Xanthobacter sp. KR7-225]|uniref:alanine racemase n=1 Tax=Xanthobacter sp. KR7-225 TaxID=3156613 RepID=UPI0032B52833
MNAPRAGTGAHRALWAEIDLDAVAHNFRALRGALAPGVALHACLKGDAYGCGIAAVAPLLARAGATHFAVGNIADARAIRACGLGQPVLLLYPNVLPGAAAEVAAEVAALDLTITLQGADEARAWAAAARRPVPAFVKIDMGAFRGGVMPEAAGELAAAIGAAGCFDIAGAYGHLHLPEPTGMDAQARWQLGRFLAGVAALEAAGVPVPVRMVSGTAAALQFPEMDLDAVDPGRFLVGLGVPGATRALGLRPALHALKAALLAVKAVRRTDRGGFEGPFPMTRDMRIGLIPFGWSDGCPRPLPPGMTALVRGRRVPLLGPTHFEHLRVDLTEVPEATFGDEVVLIGRQGDEEIPLEEAARTWGLVPLQLMGDLRTRIPRLYRGGA